MGSLYNNRRYISFIQQEDIIDADLKKDFTGLLTKFVGKMSIIEAILCLKPWVYKNYKYQ